MYFFETNPSSHGGFQTNDPYPKMQVTPSKDTSGSTRAVGQHPSGTTAPPDMIGYTVWYGVVVEGVWYGVVVEGGE
jgi:hypothetical protein